MRSPDRGPRLLPWAALVVTLGTSAPRAEAQPEDVAPPAEEVASPSSGVAARLATTERTIAALATKRTSARALLAARLRALHKRERAGFRRLWVEPEARHAWLRRRALATRVLRRDLAELAILDDELASAEAAEGRARAELAAADAAMAPEPPPPRSLARPVAGARILTAFGEKRERGSRVVLAPRGVRLSSSPGDAIVSVADGVVRWSGTLAGASAVLLDHPGGFSSFLAGLGDPPPSGRAFSRGEELGRAAAGSVYLEIRLQAGAFGQPVDPAPLLAR